MPSNASLRLVPLSSPGLSPPADQPRLPLELQERVIDFIAFEDIYHPGSTYPICYNLATCALTCRDWVPRSFFHLAYHRVLKSASGFISSKQFFQHFASSEKHQCRRLLVDGAAPSASTWVSCVPIQLSFALQHLQSLQLWSINLQDTHCSFVPMLRATCQTVTILHLDFVEFPTFNSLIQLLSSFPFLEDLQLTSLDIPPPSQEFYFNYTLQVKLVSLKRLLLDLSITGVSSFIEWLVFSWSKISELTSLWLVWRSVDGLEEEINLPESCRYLFQLCGNTLSVLIIDCIDNSLDQLYLLSLEHCIVLESLRVSISPGHKSWSISEYSQIFSYCIMNISSTEVEKVSFDFFISKIEDFDLIPWNTLDSSFSSNTKADQWGFLQRIELMFYLNVELVSWESIIAKAEELFPTSMFYLWDPGVIGRKNYDGGDWVYIRSDIQEDVDYY